MGGLNPIPVTKIIEYSLLTGVHNKELFKKVIMDIDRKYMSAVHEKQESKKPKKSR